MSDYQWPVDFWPHQLRGCQAIKDRIANNVRRIIYTAPCGTGKSRVMAAMTEYGSSEWWNTILYTHRRMLLKQTSDVLTKHGINHGIRASGHPRALLRAVQLAMIQSERSAVLIRGARDIHDAQLVLSDEIHACGGETLPELHKRHYNAGATVIGVTATPIDLVGEWDDIVVACTTSEGRKCGALVPAVTYCPDEPDMKHIKNYRVGDDLTDQQNRKVMMRPGIFGRVFSHWRTLNPEAKPTLLFAPDVAGSIYFAEEFHKQGVRSAHIDAKQIWLDGEYMASDDDNRAMVLQAVREGDIKVLSSRFLLREAIDIPEVAHCIFACVVGSLRSWLQMGGRAIRHHPSTPFVCIQDHGANFRRHGSLNDDREWGLNMSGRKITGMREEAMRETPELEPILCPNCGMIRSRGNACLPSPPGCGYSYNKRSRMVVQVDGKLKLVEGPSYSKRYRKERSDTEEKWIQMFHRAKSKKWSATFRQAEALFCRENGYYPPTDLPMMPIDPQDWWEKVSAVPLERLR